MKEKIDGQKREWIVVEKLVVTIGKEQEELNKEEVNRMASNGTEYKQKEEMQVHTVNITIENKSKRKSYERKTKIEAIQNSREMRKRKEYKKKIQEGNATDKVTEEIKIKGEIETEEKKKIQTVQGETVRGEMAKLGLGQVRGKILRTLRFEELASYEVWEIRTGIQKSTHRFLATEVSKQLSGRVRYSSAKLQMLHFNVYQIRTFTRL